MSSDRSNGKSTNSSRTIKRRDVVKGIGATAIGSAGLSGTSLAGCKDEGCEKCDEEKGGPTRYLIAHRPPGNPDNCQELCLPKPAAEAHLDEHEEDSCGPCEDSNNYEKPGKKKGEHKDRK